MPELWMPEVLEDADVGEEMKEPGSRRCGGVGESGVEGDVGGGAGMRPSASEKEAGAARAVEEEVRVRARTRGGAAVGEDLVTGEVGATGMRMPAHLVGPRCGSRPVGKWA